MNKTALKVGLIYCALAIVFKLCVLLGGYTFSTFGFYYSHFISVVLIIPFLFLAIYSVRESNNPVYVIQNGTVILDESQGSNKGLIGGREAVRVALTVLAVAMVITSIYNYIEYVWKVQDLSAEYYRSPVYLERLKEMQAQVPDKIKVEDFPKIIDEQLAALSPFKATTGKIMPMLVIGLGASFIAAVTMKKSR